MSRNKASHFTFDSSNGTFQCMFGRWKRKKLNVNVVGLCVPANRIEKTRQIQSVGACSWHQQIATRKTTTSSIANGFSFWIPATIALHTHILIRFGKRNILFKFRASNFPENAMNSHLLRAALIKAHSTLAIAHLNNKSVWIHLFYCCPMRWYRCCYCSCRYRWYCTFYSAHTFEMQSVRFLLASLQHLYSGSVGCHRLTMFLIDVDF